MIATQFRLWPLLFIGLLLSGCKSITTQISPEFIPPPATVILSFDDGPNSCGDTTARMLDILKKYEVRAMFALLGENAEEHPELVRRIDAEGHYIINHGYADKHSHTMNRNDFLNNLIEGEAAISAALGLAPGKEYTPKLYRPHGGFYNSEQENLCRNAGYTIIPAGIRVYDAVLKRDQQERVLRQTLKKIEKHNGGIVLLHDARGSQRSMIKELEKNPNSAYDRSWMPDVVEKIIITLLERGFTIGSPALIIPEYQ